MAVAVRIDQA